MRLGRKFPVLIIAVSALYSVACSITTESILEMQEGSAIEMTLLNFPAQNLELEGGVVMNMDISIGFFDLILGNIGGDISVGDLLFATDPFNFFGFPQLYTEEVCIVSDAADPGGGTFNANIYFSSADFDVALNTTALIGNETLAGSITGGGLSLPFALNATLPMTLGDMLGLLTGGSGSFEVTQDVEEDIHLEIELFPGFFVEYEPHLSGSLTLASADAFPSTPLIDDCIAFLNE